MSRPTDAHQERPGQEGEDPRCAAEGHAPGPASASCPRCQALEARIAALEAAAAERAAGSDAASAPAINLPPLEFQALRLIPHGWGEGWQLRPSPPRRHWMDQATHAYQCLPLVLANQ